MARLAVVLGLALGMATTAASSTSESTSVEVAAPDPLDRLVDCLAWAESRGDPQAYNRTSGAAGLLQFLYGTWLGTPQGQAGFSRYDPVASRAAAKWMIGQGRLREWVTWRQCA